MPERAIEAQLKKVCEAVGAEAEEGALSLLASNAEGSVRDALSLLDRCLSGGRRLSRDDVLFLLGLSGTETYLDITDAVLSGDTGRALAAFSQVLSEGKEVLQFTRDWVEHFRNLLLIKYVERPEKILNLSVENIERIRRQSDRVSLKRIRSCVDTLSQALLDARWSPKPSVLIELAIVSMASPAEEA